MAPRLLVPTLPGQVGGPPPGPGPRLVSLGGVTLTTPTQPQPSRAKQVVSSSTPVLLQPANRYPAPLHHNDITLILNINILIV